MRQIRQLRRVLFCRHLLDEHFIPVVSRKSKFDIKDTTTANTYPTTEGPMRTANNKETYLNLRAGRRQERNTATNEHHERTKTAVSVANIKIFASQRFAVASQPTVMSIAFSSRITVTEDLSWQREVGLQGSQPISTAVDQPETLQRHQTKTKPTTGAHASNRERTRTGHTQMRDKCVVE